MLADKTRIWNRGRGLAGEADLEIVYLDETLHVHWIRSSREKTAWDEKSILTIWGGAGEIWDPIVPREERE